MTTDISTSQHSRNHTDTEECPPPYTVLEEKSQPHTATTSQPTPSGSNRQRAVSVWRSLYQRAGNLLRDAVSPRDDSRHTITTTNSLHQGPFMQPFVRSSNVGFFGSGKTWKFQVLSLHVPVEHHYPDYEENTPWIARVAICVNDPDLLHTAIPWRGNLESAWYDQTDIDWNSPIRGVIMFGRGLKLTQLSHDRTALPIWSVSVRLWSRDWDFLAGDGFVAKVRELVNPKTNVSIMGWMYENQKPAPPIQHRFFIKYTKPLLPSTWKEARDAGELKSAEKGSQSPSTLGSSQTDGLDVDLPMLRQLVEERYKALFFGS